MTLLEAITEVKDSMTDIKSFHYADQFEINMLTDKFLESKYPFMLVLPFDVADVPRKSGALHGTVNLDIYFLTKVEAQTQDYVTSDVETEVMTTLRLLARRFAHKLNEHDIIDPEGEGITQRTYTPQYGLYDAHTFGIQLTMAVPIAERATNICSP